MQFEDHRRWAVIWSWNLFQFDCNIRYVKLNSLHFVASWNITLKSIALFIIAKNHKLCFKLTTLVILLISGTFEVMRIVKLTHYWFSGNKYSRARDEKMAANKSWDSALSSESQILHCMNDRFERYSALIFDVTFVEGWNTVWKHSFCLHKV